MHDAPVPRHPRHRVLADLGAAVARAEAAVARRRLELGGAEEDGRGARRARILLGLAEADLARLRLSREALLADMAR